MNWQTVTHDEFKCGEYRVHAPLTDEGWVAYHRNQRVGVYDHPAKARAACERHAQREERKRKAAANPRRSIWARVFRRWGA